MVYSFTVVPGGFEVNQAWLQIGYKKFVDAVKRLDYLNCVYEKRIENAVYYRKSMPSTRVGVVFSLRKVLCRKGLRVYGLVFGCTLVANIAEKTLCRRVSYRAFSFLGADNRLYRYSGRNPVMSDFCRVRFSGFLMNNAQPLKKSCNFCRVR